MPIGDVVAFSLLGRSWVKSVNVADVDVGADGGILLIYLSLPKQER
jgi:hypothetical protein